MTLYGTSQDNLRTYSPLDPCTEEELALLEDTAQVVLTYPIIPCNDCKYCMPCPYGLDIPAILLHYNRCVNEGNIPKSSRDENYREARRAFLIGYDRSVPKLRQASHCTGCDQCNPHCPQKHRYTQKLREIDRFVENPNKRDYNTNGKRKIRPIFGGTNNEESDANEEKNILLLSVAGLWTMAGFAQTARTAPHYPEPHYRRSGSNRNKNETDIRHLPMTISVVNRKALEQRFNHPYCPH